MNEKTFLQLMRKPRLSPTKVQLTSPGGRISIRGKFFTQTCVKQETFKFRAMVVHNRSDNNLLSRTVAEEMVLVKRIEEIKENVFGASALLKTDSVAIRLKEGVAQHVEFHFHFRRR